MQYFKHKDLNINHYNIFLKIFSKINKFYLFDYYIETGTVIAILINWIYNARVDFTWKKIRKKRLISYFFSKVLFSRKFTLNLIWRLIKFANWILNTWLSCFLLMVVSDFRIFSLLLSSIFYILKQPLNK